MNTLLHMQGCVLSTGDAMLCITTGTGLPALVMMAALSWASSRLGSRLWQQSQGKKKAASGVVLLTLMPAQKQVTCLRSWLVIQQRLLLQICMGKPPGPVDGLNLPLLPFNTPVPVAFTCKALHSHPCTLKVLPGVSLPGKCAFVMPNTEYGEPHCVVPACHVVL